MMNVSDQYVSRDNGKPYATYNGDALLSVLHDDEKKALEIMDALTVGFTMEQTESEGVHPTRRSWTPLKKLGVENRDILNLKKKEREIVDSDWPEGVSTIRQFTKTISRHTSE